MQNQQIEDYKGRFDFYCEAHGIGEEKQKALFLTSIGQQMYVKLKTWIRPRTFSELTLAQIVAKLKDSTMEKTIEILDFYKSLENNYDISMCRKCMVIIKCTIAQTFTAQMMWSAEISCTAQG